MSHVMDSCTALHPVRTVSSP